jgi:hypothetical protein
MGALPHEVAGTEDLTHRLPVDLVEDGLESE